MSLSSEQLQLIRESFDRVRNDLHTPSESFYQALFRRAPELRGMFRDDLSGQGMKFMSTLTVIVDNLHDPTALERRYVELGQQHASLGVTRRDFEPLGEALIDTLRDAMGDAFDVKTELAWRQAYEELAETLIDKGGIGSA